MYFLELCKVFLFFWIFFMSLESGVHLCMFFFCCPLKSILWLFSLSFYFHRTFIINNMFTGMYQFAVDWKIFIQQINLVTTFLYICTDLFRLNMLRVYWNVRHKLTTQFYCSLNLISNIRAFNGNFALNFSFNIFSVWCCIKIDLF